jgi:hypothetical protein
MYKLAPDNKQYGRVRRFQQQINTAAPTPAGEFQRSEFVNNNQIGGFLDCLLQGGIAKFHTGISKNKRSPLF